MESELDLLLGTAVDSLLKLDILLHLYGGPGPACPTSPVAGSPAGRVAGVASASEIALQLQRPEDQTAQALDALSQVGLIARFALGTGRHVLYGLPDDSHVLELLALLHGRYHRDQISRTELVRQTMRRSSDSAAGSHPAPVGQELAPACAQGTAASCCPTERRQARPDGDKADAAPTRAEDDAAARP